MEVRFEVRRTWRDWLAALWYCQHNARVIADFEYRMSRVLSEATEHRMSKPYYDLETMLAEIRDAQNRAYEEAYEEGVRYGG